jgi:hypothetical protein
MIVFGLSDPSRVTWFRGGIALCAVGGMSIYLVDAWTGGVKYSCLFVASVIIILIGVFIRVFWGI